MKRDKSFEIFIAVFIVTIIIAVVYGFNKNTKDAFYGGDRMANTYNYYTVNSSNNTMLEPDYDTSRPVKGMKVNNITLSKEQIDNIAYEVNRNSSFVDREINEGLTSGKVYK